MPRPIGDHEFRIYANEFSAPAQLYHSSPVAYVVYTRSSEGESAMDRKDRKDLVGGSVTH